MKENSLAVFEGKQIRRYYDEERETWYFSVVDIIQVLIQQPDYQKARKYWNKLKERLKKEGSQSVTNCHRLKMEAADGKKGGGIARKARRELELKTGKKVVTGEKFLPPGAKKVLSKKKDDKKTWKGINNKTKSGISLHPEDPFKQFADNVSANPQSAAKANINNKLNTMFSANSTYRFGKKSILPTRNQVLNINHTTNCIYRCFRGFQQ